MRPIPLLLPSALSLLGQGGVKLNINVAKEAGRTRNGQYAQLEAVGQLKSLASPRRISPEQGAISIPFSLPLHGVSLIRLAW